MATFAFDFRSVSPSTLKSALQHQDQREFPAEAAMSQRYIPFGLQFNPYYCPFCSKAIDSTATYATCPVCNTGFHGTCLQNYINRTGTTACPGCADYPTGKPDPQDVANSKVVDLDDDAYYQLIHSTWPSMEDANEDEPRRISLLASNVDLADHDENPSIEFAIIMQSLDEFISLMDAENPLTEAGLNAWFDVSLAPSNPIIFPRSADDFVASDCYMRTPATVSDNLVRWLHAYRHNYPEDFLRWYSGNERPKLTQEIPHRRMTLRTDFVWPTNPISWHIFGWKGSKWLIPKLSTDPPAFWLLQTALIKKLQVNASARRSQHAERVHRTYTINAFGDRILASTELAAQNVPLTPPDDVVATAAESVDTGIGPEGRWGVLERRVYLDLADDGPRFLHRVAKRMDQLYLPEEPHEFTSVDVFMNTYGMSDLKVSGLPDEDQWY